MPLLRSGRRRRISIARFIVYLFGFALSLVFTQPRWQSWTISPELARAESVLWVTAHRKSHSSGVQAYYRNI